MRRYAQLGGYALALTACVFACSHDWDAYDPRLGDGGETGAGTGGAAQGGAKSGGGGASVGGAGGSGASSGGGAPSGGTSGGGTAGSGLAGGSGGAAGGNGGATGGGGGASGATAGGGSGGATGGGGAGGGGTGGTMGGGGTGGGTSGGGTGGSGGVVDAGPTQKSYSAAVADCSSLLTKNPDICMQKTYTYGMSVDSLNEGYAVPDASTGEATAVFLRFNLDGAFSGSTVTKVSLGLTVTTQSGANSTSTGEVWRVQCFTRTDLFSLTPAKVGSTPLAPAQAAGTLGMDITFNLPVSSVTASQPACFGIFPVNSNGVDYYNNFGTKPPRLVIEYQ